MKRFIVIFAMLVGVQALGQVDTLNPLTQEEIADSVFGNLNSFIPTQKLWNRLLYDDTSYSITWNIDSIGKSWNHFPASADYIYGVIREMKTMSIDTSSVPSLMAVYDPVAAYIGEKEFDEENLIYPVGIVDFNFNYLNVDENILNGSLNKSNEVLSSNNNNILFETKSVQLVAPLFDYFESEQMGLIFKQDNYLSNRLTASDVESIELNFNNQTTVISWDEVYYFTPKEDTVQQFFVRVNYTDHSYIENYFVINTPELSLKNVQKTHSFPKCTDLKLDNKDEIEIDGNKLKWCWIPGCGSDGRVFKPYLLLTGYRPPIIGQSFNKTWRIYNNEHGSLLQSLRDNNYDILLVKFNIHAKPYEHGMQESAELLIRFIELLNIAKGGANSGQENIIQGSSMSADIANLALLKMEKHHLEDNNYPHHHSRLFIAYDANFFGANLPLAYQYQIYSHFKYHAINPIFGNATYYSIKDLLSTFMFATLQQKTVKELLAYHATADDDNIFNLPYYQLSTTPSHHWRRQSYYDALNAVDNGVYIFPMPLATRNISISLGKINGTNNQETELSFNDPGEYWRDINLGLWNFRLRASIYTSDYTELFWRKKLALTWNSIYVNHRVHVKNMREEDMASGSYLDGSGNLMSVADWTYFTLPNIFDGKDYFTHKSVLTALGINPTLWPANGSMTLDMHSLGLMFNNLDIVNNPQSNYYGYPNLGRPNDHFQITPFEAIYVDNKINPHIILKDDDAVDLAELNGFILNEVEPWYLGLQNTNLGSKARSNYEYFSYRRAAYQIVVGHLVTPTTDPGDYVVEQNGKLVLKSSEINLKPGVHFKSGSNVHIVPEYEACSNTKMMSNEGGENPEIKSSSLEKAVDATEKNDPIRIFPNPPNDKLTIEGMEGEEIQSVLVYNLEGTLLFQSTEKINTLVLETATFQQGLYLLHVTTQNTIFTKQFLKL